jgi:hypothetical protein
MKAFCARSEAAGVQIELLSKATPVRRLTHIKASAGLAPPFFLLLRRMSKREDNHYYI